MEVHIPKNKEELMGLVGNLVPLKLGKDELYRLRTFNGIIRIPVGDGYEFLNQIVHFRGIGDYIGAESIQGLWLRKDSFDLHASFTEEGIFQSFESMSDFAQPLYSLKYEGEEFIPRRQALINNGSWKRTDTHQYPTEEDAKLEGFKMRGDTFRV